MKSNDLRAGRIYIGHFPESGIREILHIIRDRKSLVRYAWQTVFDGGVGTCSAPEFARWAKCEMPKDEPQ